MINKQERLYRLKNMFSPLDNFEEKLYVRQLLSLSHLAIIQQIMVAC